MEGKDRRGKGKGEILRGVEEEERGERGKDRFKREWRRERRGKGERGI